jgi:hypothetical protein
VDIEEGFLQRVCRPLLQTPCQGTIPGESDRDAPSGRCRAASDAAFGAVRAVALQQAARAVSFDSLI